VKGFFYEIMAQKEILPPKAVGFTVINKLKLAIE